MSRDILAEATRFGVIPVVEIDAVDDADALAESLLEGGLGVVEVTFRTAAAADVIARISGRYADMLVGAGTVVTEADLRIASSAGARFSLAPGLSTRLLSVAREIGMPYAPGCMTPSDLQAGFEHGLKLFKFFPAMPAGGLPFLRAIAAPFALQGPRFIPTGGLRQENIADWLAEPAVAAIGGTWIANRSLVRSGDWAGIRRSAAAAVEAANRVRSAR